jgi:hypothetical protein
MRAQTFSAIVFMLALGGCAQLQSTPPGTPAADVIKQFGKPTTVCRNQDGTERLVWSQQPFGHQAWGTNTTKDNTIGFFTQVLTDAHFDLLNTGIWSDARVLCEFGPPASIDGISRGDEKVWSYRYMQSSAWYSMMYVYMGPEGNLANRHNPGPDPMYVRRD